MHVLRTRFKNQIVCEFLPPAPRRSRATVAARKSSKVIIFCSGLPSMPGKIGFLDFFAKKGYWVFALRYRGSWESGGRFLQKSPEQDVLDLIDELPKGFSDIWTEKKFKIAKPKIYIFGFSFGGPAAILASRDKRVNKCVCIYSVADWRLPSKDESMDKLELFVRLAFGGSYRFRHSDWKKLADGSFYNPVNHIKEIDGKKLFFIHAKDDRNVDYHPAEKFARAVGAKFWLLPKGGHGGWDITSPKFYKKIAKFLN